MKSNSPRLRVAYGASSRKAVPDQPAALYELTIEEAQNLIRSHGRVVPRERTLQMYCARHEIDACKASTTRHGKIIMFWLINRASLLDWIASRPRIVATRLEPGTTIGKEAEDQADLPSLRDLLTRPLAERKRAAALLRDIADQLAARPSC